MSDAFLSSDDFDEQAHHLYNEGRYDEALLYQTREILRKGVMGDARHRDAFTAAGFF